MAPFVVHDGPSQEVREIFSGSEFLEDDAFLSCRNVFVDGVSRSDSFLKCLNDKVRRRLHSERVTIAVIFNT